MVRGDKIRPKTFFLQAPSPPHEFILVWGSKGIIYPYYIFYLFIAQLDNSISWRTIPSMGKMRGIPPPPDVHDYDTEYTCLTLYLNKLYLHSRAKNYPRGVILQESYLNYHSKKVLFAFVFSYF